jgi:hypothetical protein
LPDSGTEYAVGIQSNVPSATVNTGDGLYQVVPTVVLSGVTRIRVDAAYAVGTFLMPLYSATADLNGRGTTSAATPMYTRAILLQASTAADDIVACRLLDQSPGASGGAQGVTGATGVSGYSGISGASGYSGISGTSGYSGISGASGYSGISGTSGYSGQ